MMWEQLTTSWNETWNAPRACWFFFFYTLLEAQRWSFVLDSYFGACRFKSCPAGSLSPLNDMLLNFGELDEHVWEGNDDDGDEDEEEEGKTVQPLLKISFFIKKRSHIGQALPACLPACLAAPLLLPAAVETSSGVEATGGRAQSAVCVWGYSAPRVRQINEKEGRLQSVREWSYFGFPFSGVERYSLVVSCWRRRVSCELILSGRGKVLRAAAAAVVAAAPTRLCCVRKKDANWLLTINGSNIID